MNTYERGEYFLKRLIRISKKMVDITQEQSLDVEKEQIYKI